MKCAERNYAINSCPGRGEISGRRMAPTGASVQRLSTGPAPSGYFLFFFSPLRIRRFLAPLCSGFCLLPAQPLHPCGATDCLKSSGTGRGRNLPLVQSHASRAWPSAWSSGEPRESSAADTLWWGRCPNGEPGRQQWLDLGGGNRDTTISWRQKKNEDEKKNTVLVKTGISFKRQSSLQPQKFNNYIIFLILVLKICNTQFELTN